MASSNLTCRHCNASLRLTFADLGIMPFANSYVQKDRRDQAELAFPLHAWICEDCKLVQLGEFQTPDAIFEDYDYFSSYSPSWLAHAKAYAEGMTKRFGLTDASKVVEIASNDGYLLKNFVAAGIPVLGVEPAANVAQVAIEQENVPTHVAFFGVETAKALAAHGHKADLMAANNVLAHVPDINDFVGGFRELLKDQGVATFEFPHLQNLVEKNQFDTIYHEHFSYLSLTAVERIFAKQGLRVFDIETLPTHGGSLRVFACHENAAHETQPAVGDCLTGEQAAGLDDANKLAAFAQRPLSAKLETLDFLLTAKCDGKSVVGYGAPAKGNTFLNYLGVGPELLVYTVDASPHKQGKYLPGTGIEIFAPDKIAETRPDYVLILPWNLKTEIMGQLSFIQDWGGKFVTAIPSLTIE